MKNCEYPIETRKCTIYFEIYIFFHLLSSMKRPTFDKINNLSEVTKIYRRNI